MNNPIVSIVNMPQKELLKRSDLASNENGKGASLIGIEDVENNLTATNVEEALREIMQNDCYAEIYYHDGTDVISMPSGDVYTKVSSFTHNGEYKRAIPDALNSQITINRTGVYFITALFSTICGSPNITLRTALFVNDIEQNNAHVLRKYQAGNDAGFGAFNAIVRIDNVPAVVDVRARHDGGSSVNFTSVYGNLNVKRISS